MKTKVIEFKSLLWPPNGPAECAVVFPKPISLQRPRDEADTIVDEMIALLVAEAEHPSSDRQ